MGLGDLIGAAVNPFGLPSKGTWNIIAGSFQPMEDGLPKGKPMEFFFEGPADPSIGQQIRGLKGGDPNRKSGLETITDGGGRRKAVYEYPYKDGQRLDDLGQRGEKLVFNLKFFGPNYKDLFDEFKERVVESRASGILMHPVRGEFTCGFLEHEFIHRHDEWNAVTVRATFIEDNFKDDLLPSLSRNPSSSLRSALGALNTAQATITALISDVSALLLLPAAIQAGLQARLDSIVGAGAALLGQLAASFSNDTKVKAATAANAVATASAQSVSGSAGTAPPVFQTGASATDKAAMATITASFNQKNQITPLQAVFQANVMRAQVSEAITYAEENLGSDGAAMVLEYRVLANTFQATTEAALAGSQSAIKTYTVPFVMSLRQVAKLNALNEDRQNDIDQLNPNLESINFVPPGTVLLVPTA